MMNDRCRRGNRRTGRVRAFTLIEILIVVTILGILAAIVIPRFWDAGTSAADVTVAAQLRTIRGQVTLYNYHHADEPFDPLVLGGATGWNQLVANDYLESAPMNPFQENAVTVASAPAAGAGWVWTDLGYGPNIYAVDGAGNYFDGNGDGIPD